MGEKWDHTKLAPGDPVAYMDHHGRGWSTYATTVFATVARLTATQIILSNGKRFRLRDAGMVGGSPYAKLVDATGSEAVAARVLEEHNRVLKALEELRRVKQPSKPEAMSEWLDRVAGVVDASRARLREIGGAQ